MRWLFDAAFGKKSVPERYRPEANRKSNLIVPEYNTQMVPSGRNIFLTCCERPVGAIGRCPLGPTAEANDVLWLSRAPFKQGDPIDI